MAGPGAEARGQARLRQRREVHASLDHGARLLEQLPKPEHPENHFMFDHTKWIFYAATCYTWLVDDEPAEEHARELIAYHTLPDGSSNAPMRTAMSHIDLGLIRARHGDLDEAIDHKTNFVNLLAVDPYFDPLRSDHRFAQALKRLNLPR